MYLFVTYLSTDNRQKLRDLDKKILGAQDMEERIKLQAERVLIEEMTIPLHKCNIEQCQELEHQFATEMQKWAGLGKRTQVQQFQQMVLAVRQRSQTLFIEAAEKERKRQEEIDKKGETVDVKPEKPKGGSRVKARATSSKWTLDIDDLD